MKNIKHIFLNEVTDQIKSKEAKKFVAVELGYHLKETKKVWIEKGLSESEAEIKAVEQMGSPVKLGQQLNKLHKPKVDWLLVILFVTTLGLGFLPLFSLGYMNEGHFSTFKIIIALISGTAALGIMLIDYRKWKKHGWVFYAFGMLILLLLRFFSNTTVNGLPLLRIPPITIESLMAVPFFFLAWASFLSNTRLKVWQFGILLLIPVFFFLALPSVSNTYIYTVMVFVMLWWSTFNRRTVLFIWAFSFSSLLLLGVISWNTLKDYQLVRFLAFLNPEKYYDGPGYLILRVKDLLSNAGWFGNHTDKQVFIPEAHTNFVFVSFTYYYGWLFAIALVVILSLFVARIIVVMNKIHDPFGKLLLIGAVALYAVQLGTNVGMSLGVVPLISMSLPFISYGLMPTLLNAILIGVVLSVYRRKDIASNQGII
ncbi:FtsW/RodA/SpoVE family cell cycle protein [Paenibacillus sp. BSR1-1]|uniref:FtsW/RodA/SpoVE family cell cycle protein n=1 Tax=Paenibacillus sp. BSR1-1 TaxID=3020845 RepID=UPI0025B1EE77|nr:FtsW/RodA/SpoVE family cell cycle protein [Paenibacillus sp. BSR1-1]MDN3018346.1 FtsW/RodA/SpoVE family cell cycle protein [Paenibacillus sp. BSR1-1]